MMKIKTIITTVISMISCSSYADIESNFVALVNCEFDCETVVVPLKYIWKYNGNVSACHSNAPARISEGSECFSAGSTHATTRRNKCSSSWGNTRYRHDMATCVMKTN